MAEKDKFTGFTKAGNPELGLALVFDISGFTNFFNKPDLQYYITDYINHIIECIEINIYGGNAYWVPEEEFKSNLPLTLKPKMRKFLGDGMLYIWENDEKNTLNNDSFKIKLINRLWNLQLHYNYINKHLYERIPIGDLPTTVKFGIAKGTLYKLTEKDGTNDYIGPCINLASRLVKYCQEINFIASARLDISKEKLIEHGYFRIIAKELRSFENEIIFIERKDYDRINEPDKLRLFKEI